MASPVPSRVPRPGYFPPNFNPNYQNNPNSLSDSMQNLQINHLPGPPPAMPNTSGPRPPPFVTPPFQSSVPPHISPASFPGVAPVSRPGPPPADIARVGAPPPGPQPVNLVSNLASGRSSGPPFSLSAPFGSRPPPPGVYPSAPMMTGPIAPSPNVQGLMSNGPPTFAQGSFPGGPRSSPIGSTQRPPAGPPPVGSFPRDPQASSVHPFLGSPPAGPPLGPFSTSSQGMPPTSAPLYGSQPWQMQPQQGSPLAPGTMPPPRTFGMTPGLPNQPMPPVPPGMGHPSVSGAPVAGSKIDPNQIPRPIPSSPVTIFDTRQNNQANNPPPATSEYIVRDTGNCSPRYMRCTINQIPCSGDLLTTSGMLLALMVQPLAVPHPSEEPIQVVDFGEGGPVRCSRCKGYINPFMKFIDQGKRFICNLCGFINETPCDYYCNTAPDGRRRDADERPELCRGTVEFVATKEYMVRDPMPAVFFFLIDVSMNAIQTGATAAACSAINQAIIDLPEGPRTMVGIATFDSAIHFYNLKRALQQPLMFIVPDVQDVYTPLQTDIIVQLAECRQHLEQLLESIPTMFQNNRVTESAFGAAIKAAYLAMKSTGGKLLVFQSVLPSVGIGSLSAREAEGRTNVSAGEKETNKLLQPADKTLKTMAIEFAECQVCVDIFVTTQSYIDIASMSVVPTTTGGQLYYYHPFSALSDSAKLYNDLRWNIARPQGFEAVMRVRCSQGLQVQEYSGNFCKRIPTDIDLPGIDCDKTIMVTFKHDDKFQDGSECAFQCALLYTTVYGQRRIRIQTLSLPCTTVLSNLFRTADLDTQFTGFLKQAANEIPTSPLVQVRDEITNLCINILHTYRKFCATVSSSGQLILPEALKLLPLYTLALAKSVGLRTDGRVDDRSYWVSHVASLSTPLAVPLVYPRMMAIHNLASKEADGSLLPPIIPLSSENVTDDGIFLLENGEDCLIYVGNTVNPDILMQLFGISLVEEIPSQFLLQQFDNELSKKVNDVVNEIRRQRSSYLRLQLCRKGDTSGSLFFSYLVEDKTANALSYVEFLVHVHRQIQTKMA
ncbi:protein transport protein SEC24 C-like [Magnolia sinica]|uniref:protein transport protein SEC24 C-like n=1 Tax=Magnolia sinica TaxID=86752 RepID=UPI0026586722|nr:protein transport protein SEC24 C-like [Magnolia sinica]